jgi:hypothetical protein
VPLPPLPAATLARLSAPVAVLLAALAPVAAAASPPAPAGLAVDLPALVARCVEAYGGPKALARLAHVTAEGSVTSTLHPGDAGHLVRAFERPRRLRVEIQYPGQEGEVRVLDGERGWRSGAPVSGPLLSSMVLQAARLDLPALLSARGARLVDRGTWTHEGSVLRVIAVQVSPGVEVEAGLDPASGRILRSRSTATGEMPLEFITTYADFRTVDGALVPFREGNWANGQSTGGTTLERVSLPGRYPDKLFRP